MAENRAEKSLETGHHPKTRMSGGSKRLLGKTKLEVSEGCVTLILRRSARLHSGEVVSKRLAGLAQVMGLDSQIVQH